ncbi:hypothetical protein NBRC10512_000837 [Rhodotorula toruloides]|uniref:RHTO0S06e07734g1_1 n=2 Tax=Rhodotorula toruloides TaxID=5286 RepID=A0A061B2M4_RHOTO|nr:DUF1749 family protein [Rhodotorula toruloides NP11]EMS24326.1 DUF1749 family protein [Rhodotorula toruloides NP11]CDR41910.1 RHTO0S06e07734g1_1 [Rhodotorula toruloides]
MVDPIPGQLHLISPKPLTAFEFGPPTSSSTPLVLFVAGLNDTLCSVPYLPLLAKRLSRAGWRIAQVCLTSAGAGWGGDLSDTRLSNVFGAIDCPLSIVLSGEDETYPTEVKSDLPTLLGRFRKAAAGRCSALSGIVEGAAHNLKDEQHAGEFADRVVGFLREV